MKKTIFTKGLTAIGLTLTLLAANFVSYGQFGFSIGPKAGLAITTFRGADADNIDARTNWFGGVFTNFQLAPAIAIQPEFLLTERGADVTSNNTRSSISINYFEIPLLAKIRLPLANDVIFPHVLFGPNFGFRTNVDLTSRDTQSGTAISTNTDDIRRSDLSALVGAGVDIQTRGTGVFFTIDGRYGFGLRDINDNDGMVALRNAGWTFALGLGFKIGNNDDVDD